MIIRNVYLEKIVYLQIAIGLFSNLLALYSLYQIKSFEYSSLDLGLICSFRPYSYSYKWILDLSWILATMNTMFLCFVTWWRTKINIKKLVLLLLPAEIALLDLALSIFYT